ncbi:hypothetical protein UK15_11770 [Streptomyces variegatus]|uniref:Gliding motility protein n=1 Tax=Streptomyces variegatus TaxID=284040 RepID=A0A0M2GNN6_9ACTN|nr:MULTISPECIES: hypothetical protein [Streptomyces]KJK39694.1 hypothetical protein UK15_11770 [Streptomyces variegatus]
MGVFARLLRRSKATAETPAAEAQTDTAKAGPEAQAAEAAETKGIEGAEEAAEPAGEAAAEVTESEGVESEGVDIPKQQSTEKAADNEAGEGART